MSPTIAEQIERITRAIAEMEAQRDLLGDAMVQKAMEPLREKLRELSQQLEASQVSSSGKPLQQRKLVTLLFMDIVGSTSIIQHMDPEDVSEIFDANLKHLAQPVEDYGGHVTSFTGDGFMALFGAPIAREDDPERAVRAGLAIIQRAEGLARELAQERGIQDFKVRVGIHTGLIILGGETEGEDTTKGPAVHLAARLQSAAPPGGLLVSHDTYRHIRGVFDVQPWEPIQVKGFDEPVQVYRVERTRPRAFHAYTRGVEGVETRMVGRDAELKYLQEASLSAFEDGEGQVITILGEAGVGKSRLLYEFQNWIELLPPPAVLFYEGRGHQEAQGLPYGLLRDLFEFRFQLQENDTKEAICEKVESGFLAVFGGDEEAQMRAHILGQWLGFDFTASPHLRGVLNDAEQLRNRGLMYVGEYFTRLCQQAPVVIFLDDIHWADDSSLDALNWLGERLQHQSVLFLCASRKTLLERRPYWGEGLAYHHHLELEPLSRRESYQLVKEIFKLAEKVPAELVDLVVEGAEGNPFYLEELVKMLVEDGVVTKGEETWQVIPERLSEIKVPPTLAGVLQARLESLPAEEQQVLQQASVVGRLFWDEVVAHIQAAEGGRPQVVPEVLASLRSREMIYRRETSAFMEAKEYIFKHDILREVTCESVLKRLRRKYHGLVADWLISQVGERLGEYSGLIAGHLLQADRKEQAGEYLIKAGQAALSSYANVEAESYFRQALSLPLVDDQKADCLASLGESLRRQGQRQESDEALRRALEISISLGKVDKAAGLYARLAEVIWRYDRSEGYEICQEGLKRLQGAAEGPGMARLLAEAGRTAHFQGRPADEVISLCKEAIEMAEQQGELEAKVGASDTIALATDDFITQINLLQEAAAFSEANGVWYQAGRAYHNLAIALLREHVENAVQRAIELVLKTIDLALKIGDIEALLFTLDNMAGILIVQGKLKAAVDQTREILARSTVPQSRVEELLQDINSRLHGWSGEWLEACNYQKNLLGKGIYADNLEHLGETYYDLAFNLLELDRFGGPSNLSLAEDAIQRMNVSKTFERSSLYMQVILHARRKHFDEAHKMLNVESQNLNQPHKPSSVVQRPQAEAELARQEGSWDVAIDKCQSLIDTYRRGGYGWNLARYLIDLGDALRGRNQPGDREDAEKVYRQSLEMFTEMDAPGYIQVLKERLGEISANNPT